MKMKHALFVSLAVLLLIAFACKKEAASSTLRVRMTDAPTALDEVNIDLQKVVIKFAKDSGEWVTMNTRAGVYNLLALQNGVDTLIAEGTYPEGEVKEIRLILGSNNSVKENGTVYPLTIPSGSESGLKIKVGKQLRNRMDSLLIDFDAALSVKKEDGGYKLRPVIKLK